MQSGWARMFDLLVWWLFATGRPADCMWASVLGRSRSLWGDGLGGSLDDWKGIPWRRPHPQAGNWLSGTYQVPPWLLDVPVRDEFGAPSGQFISVGLGEDGVIGGFSHAGQPPSRTIEWVTSAAVGGMAAPVPLVKAPAPVSYTHLTLPTICSV